MAREHNRITCRGNGRRAPFNMHFAIGSPLMLYRGSRCGRLISRICNLGFSGIRRVTIQRGADLKD